MTRAKKLLAVLVVASFGLWGCAQGPTNAPGSAERIRALETKLAKIEDDFRAAVTVRDQLRKKLTASEEQRDQQNQELQNLVRDRDDLRQLRDALHTQLTTRTSERDALQAQYEQFRKTLRGLLGQAETSVSTLNDQPVLPSVETAAANKS